MTIQDLGALGEPLGSVAVLATLIYLALRTRQNTMAISAQLDAASIAATQGLMIGDKLATVPSVKSPGSSSLGVNLYLVPNFTSCSFKSVTLASAMIDLLVGRLWSGPRG